MPLEGSKKCVDSTDFKVELTQDRIHKKSGPKLRRIAPPAFEGLQGQVSESEHTNKLAALADSFLLRKRENQFFPHF